MHPRGSGHGGDIDLRIAAASHLDPIALCQVLARRRDCLVGRQRGHWHPKRQAEIDALGAAYRALRVFVDLVDAERIAERAPTIVETPTHRAVLRGDRVEISYWEGRQWVAAGAGRWREEHIEDCPADIGDEVYAELERLLRERAP